MRQEKNEQIAKFKDALDALMSAMERMQAQGAGRADSTAALAVSKAYASEQFL